MRHDRTTSRHPDRSRIGVLAVVLASALAGCIDVDGDLAANGSLRFRYKYDPPPHATFKSERIRLSSPSVRVEALERDPTIVDGQASEFAIATIVTDDPATLSSAPAFAGIHMSAEMAAGQLRMAFPGADREAQERIRNNPEADRQALRLSLVLPGPVAAAEPAATVDARRVTWVLTTRQFVALGNPAVFTVSWTVPPAS
jgi:hypothetical protein